MHLNDHIEDYVAKYEGNWLKFGSFAWFEKPQDADKWCIIYTENRDSDALDRCNAAVIRERLEACEGFDEDARSEDHHHWAVGWVRGYSIRVRDAAGNITPTFKVWCEIQMELEEYPILDDERLSELEYNEACEWWAHLSVRSRVEAWQETGGRFHLMACRRDELPSDDSGALEEYLRG